MIDKQARVHVQLKQLNHPKDLNRTNFMVKKDEGQRWKLLMQGTQSQNIQTLGSQPREVKKRHNGWANK